MKFEGQKLTEADILQVPSSCSKITIRECSSDEWMQLGKALASKTALTELEILNSACGDRVLLNLRFSGSIKRLRLGNHATNGDNCKMAEKALEYVSEITSLQELTVSTMLAT